MSPLPQSELNAFHKRLLRGGVSRRYADRAIREWQDHLEDLARRAGPKGTASESANDAALRQFGALEPLVQDMLRRKELKTWAWRYPRLLFLLSPILCLLAGVALVAVAIVVFGAIIDTADVAADAVPPRLIWAAHGLFGFLCFGLSPTIVSGFCVLARRRHVQLFWPVLGVSLAAFLGAGWDYTIAFPAAPGQGEINLAWGWTALGIPVGDSHNAQTLAKLSFAALNAFVILRFYTPDRTPGDSTPAG